jgi:diguanylate cyclase
VKHRSPQVVSRLAAGGLAAVFLALASVTLWAVMATQNAADSAAQSVVAGNALGQAQYYLDREAEYVSDFGRTHRTSELGRFFTASARFSGAVSSLERQDVEADATLASHMLLLHQKYVKAVTAYAADLTAHRLHAAASAHLARVLPVFAPLARIVNDRVGTERTRASRRLSSLRTQENSVRTVTLFAFLFGAVLLALCWRVLETFRKRIEAEERALEHQAMHDALTDLPNRTLLLDRMRQAVIRGLRETTPVSLLLMDLDRFKEVNDTFGHHTGDSLLQQVGFLIRSVLRQSDTVARLGGDEFGLVLPNTTREGAITAAQKLAEAFSQPLFVDGQSFHVGSSIGIAIFPEHGTDASTLLRRSDVAMYTAKREKSVYAIYAETQDQDSHVRLALSRDLRYAIERQELVLQYQPKMDMRTHEVISVEALIRWKHPQRGLLFPDRFMVLAEQTGQIKSLSLWVLGEAVRQCNVWHEAGKALGIAINLSASSLPDSQLGDTIAHYLKQYGVPPSMLEIEVTESVLMSDPARAMQVLMRLHDLGIKIAVDDFGTGYSSLAYLKRLPVDEIKIDKSFVLDMISNPEDAVIVRSIIDLAHNLGLRVVAEGVEDEQTWSLLDSMNCDEVQGFFLSRPLTLADLTFWMSERGSETQTA